MDLHLSDEQRMIRESARQIAERELLPRAKDADREGRFPLEQMRALGANGFLAMLAPAAYGGTEVGAVAYSLAMTEIARCCASTSVTMAVTNMVADAICAWGDEAQKQRYVPRLASGALVAGSFALSEPGSGSDAASLKAVAEKKGDRYLLRGTKCWITSGDRAGLLLVMAKTDVAAGARGISCFLVEPSMKGFSVGNREHKMGLRASSTVTINLDDVEVPEENRLGPEGVGFKVAMRALDGGRIGIGSQSVGIHQACLEAATRYAQDRAQFGRPIAEFQAVQWKLADLATTLDAARLLVLRAAWLKDHGAPFAREASMAKLFASESANQAALEAIQIHGGYGYIDEFPVERYLRDVRVTTIYEGTSEIQRLVIARQILSEK
ncbi:MAG: acyl-CoA dehydrogenase family protein [Deltaproteobacteria bacterium]|nr:acyl-CoA dehydrogenase family protein [Deltaproteobacteria bacterium]